MNLSLYNTLTRQKEKFQPLDAKNVRMYVCGPTVYDFAHIGNARPVVVFDVLFRLLRHVYGGSSVTYVRNITDVDDKINARAQQEGVPIQEITTRTTHQYHQDMEALETLPPTIEPKATEHISQMQELICELIELDHAYEVEGNVLFHVPSMSDYGKLSQRSLEDMIAGARIEVAPYKKDPMDFLLWKASKEGEPSWDSPWGDGRPGWHIECSAMSKEHLGETFDIHGGGIDLTFPHHENEIAQSRCAFGVEKMANFWMHNGYLQVEGQKMAKSLGNFITVNELLNSWPGEAIRLTLLMTHYRQPIDFTKRGLEEAKNILDGWYRAIENVDELGEIPESLVKELADDLNTPQALTVLHKFKSEISSGTPVSARNLKASGKLLGILQQSTDNWFNWKPKNFTMDEAEIERLISERLEARKAKDFELSDKIRDDLAKSGVALTDFKDEKTGEIKTKWTVK